MQQGADMIELDVRLTKDSQAVVIHDNRLIRTHKITATISSKTLAEIEQLTKHHAPVPSLASVLDKHFGNVLINIELKSRGSAHEVYALLSRHYIKTNADWDAVLVSSRRGAELSAFRALTPHANLALLHDENPFLFIAYQKK